MGRGDVPILCKTELPKKCSKKFIEKLNKLEKKASNILVMANSGKYFSLPCNYSDNASFLANGIPAVAVTMLPSSEVEAFMMQNIKPATWQMLHTPMDNIENLTQESFIITEKILNILADYKTVS